MKKRICSLILAFLMVFTLVPFVGITVFAEEGDPVSLENARICFDGDSSYDWAHFYSVKGKTESLTLEELNISVLDETGKTVPSEAYELKLFRTWYDEAAGRDMEEEVVPPIGINKSDYEGGFTEYNALAVAKEGSGYAGETRSTFFVMDHYSLNWICAEITFPEVQKKDGWRMHDRFFVDLEKLAPPIVKSSDGTLLKEDQDYVLTWYRRTGDIDDFDPSDIKDMDYYLDKSEKNKLPGMPKVPGGYFFTMEAKAPYYGETTVLLDVTGEMPQVIDIKDAEVSGVSAKTYNGKAQTQTPTVVLNGAVLAEGTDYTLSYENNINAGMATMTVTGIGYYTGTIEASFVINKAKQPMAVKGVNQTVKYNKKKAQTIPAKKAYKFTVAAQGKVTYKKASGAKNISVNAKTGAITIGKAAKAGKYPVRIKVTAAGTVNYKAGSKTVSLTIRIKK